MSDDSFQRYLFEYRYDGAEWGFDIMARSPEEAKERVKQLAWAKYQGEVKAKLYIPTATLATIALAMISTAFVVFITRAFS